MTPLAWCSGYPLPHVVGTLVLAPMTVLCGRAEYSMSSHHSALAQPSLWLGLLHLAFERRGAASPSLAPNLKCPRSTVWTGRVRQPKGRNLEPPQRAQIPVSNPSLEASPCGDRSICEFDVYAGTDPIKSTPKDEFNGSSEHGSLQTR